MQNNLKDSLKKLDNGINYFKNKENYLSWSKSVITASLFRFILEDGFKQGY